jgi:predicted transcriptional regulator
MAGGSGYRTDNCKAQRVSAGHSIPRLAQLANVSEWTITMLEEGGTADLAACERIAAALGIDAATLGIVNISGG